jgi:hypothetical protein
MTTRESFSHRAAAGTAGVILIVAVMPGGPRLAADMAISPITQVDLHRFFIVPASGLHARGIGLSCGQVVRNPPFPVRRDERRAILYLQHAMGPALRRPYDLMSSPLDERKRAPRQDRKGVPQDSRDLPRLPLETDDPLAGYTDRLDERFVAKQQSG